ncbi:MAG: hypothetical protein EBY41_00105 [Proteobacteria bacterium]|nr:hypothetical protein [Pseudomonadota bacterium]
MAGLSKGELAKRTNLTIFKTRVKDKKPFTLVGGGEVYVGFKDAKLNKVFLDNIKSTSSFDAFTKTGLPTYTARSESTIALSKLYKDFEFAGRAQQGTAKEDAQLAELQRMIEDAKKEMGSDSINVKLATVIVNGVTGAESTPGTPKSDFHLLGSGGKEIAWISHKDGLNEKAFGQWGGVTDVAGEKIANHKEVTAFIETVQKLYGDTMPRATTVAREITDKELQHMAVYGPKYRQNYSRDNCTALLQGTITMKKQGTYYIIDSEGPSHKNGASLTNGYTPVLMAMYKGDRTQFGIKGARFSIYPKGGRRVSEYI